jgi:fatty acid desaturase
MESATSSGLYSMAEGPLEDLTPETADPPSSAEIRANYRYLRGRIRGRVFAGKLAVAAVLLAGGVLLTLQDVMWYRLIGVAVIGLMFAHAAELQHEALHNIGFRSQHANMIAGTILGIPMLISFAAYRASHLRHHRYLGTPMNREFFDYGDQYGAMSKTRTGVVLSWLVRFSMLFHYRLFAENAWRALRGLRFEGETATVSRRIRRDHLLILGLLLASVVVSALLGTWSVVWLWLLPLVVVAAPVHAAIELPEHYRCQTLDQNIFANTRTIRSNRLMTWFTNGNNFHVEHHLMPNMPIERLPELHVRVRDRIQHFHPTYLSYFRSLIRK